MNYFFIEGKERNNNFNLLRFIFSVAVILGHSFVLGGTNMTKEPLFRFSRGRFYSGSLAVDCFFLISGFLIAKSWMDAPRLGIFLRKRSLRIFPGYFTAAILSILIAATIGAGGFGKFQWPMVSQALQFEPLYSRQCFASNPFPFFVNGSLWTIRYEFYCYLLVAVVGMAGLLQNRLAIAGLALASLMLLASQLRWQFLPYWPIPGFGSLGEWPNFLTWFTIGMAFFTWRDRIPYSTVAASICAIIVTVVLSFGRTSSLVILPPMLAYVVFFLTYTKHIRFHGFGRFGDFSYGTYLYASPVQQLLAMRFPGMNPFLMAILSLACTFPMAFASWHFVERPSLNRKAKRKAEALPPEDLIAVP